MALSWKMLYGMFWRDANGHHNPPLHNGPGYVSRKAGAELGPVPTTPEGSKISPVTQEFLINRRTGDMIPVVPGTERTLMDVVREIEESKTWIKGQMELSRDYGPSPSDVDDRHPDDYRLKDSPRDDATFERVEELIADLEEVRNKANTLAGVPPIVLPPSDGLKLASDAYNLRLVQLAFKSIFADDVDAARVWIKQLSPGAAERMYRSLNVLMAELLAKDAADNLRNYK